jgi:ABC-type bacteriocin/lantibiotic exporter with double-glycine peptidase domain
MPRDRVLSVTTLAMLGVGIGLGLAIVAPTLWDGARAYRAHRAPYPTSTPIVRQAHPSGCGAAVLATLLDRAGRPVPQVRLLAAAPPGPDGISLAAFRRLAEEHGLSGRWRRRVGPDLPDAGFVAHLVRPAGHFVYVDGRVGSYLHVLDPAEGASVWHVDMFRARWSGRYLRLGGLA